MTIQLINNPYNKIYTQPNSDFSLFDTKLTDHVLEGQDAVGWVLQGSLITMTYPDAVAKIKELYENGTDTEYRGITCRRSHDGRYVADVAQKDAIDALFTETGVADFYVLDSAGDQFYLPRTKRFHQMTLDTRLVNGFNEAGLPNIKGSLNGGDSSYGTYNSTYSGSFKASGTSRSYSFGRMNTNLYIGDVSFDASRSDPVYGASDTVQPPSANKLLYYKVGNTVVNETNINVGNILSDLELKADTDLSNTAPTQAFKYMSVGWGMPEYSSGISKAWGVLHTAETAGYVFAYIRGVSPGTSISRYLAVNGSSMAFAGGEQQRSQASSSCFIPVNKNDTYQTFNLSDTPARGVIFYPIIGASS